VKRRGLCSIIPHARKKRIVVNQIQIKHRSIQVPECQHPGYSFRGRKNPLVAVRVAAVLVLTLVDLAPVVSVPALSGVDNLGDGDDDISTVGGGRSRGDDRGLESSAGSGSGRLGCD